jgi:hypothetical protein
MTTETPTVETVANEASAWFETATRGDGETYTRTKDGCPEWVQELVYDAHGDFGPDDWRYDCIRAAVDAIADGADEDDPGEFADQHADVYTARGLAWLASNLNRVGYVDDAVSEYGYDEGRGIAGMVALGQYAEASEVFASVAQSLADRLNAIEEAA